MAVGSGCGFHVARPDHSGQRFYNVGTGTVVRGEANIQLYSFIHYFIE